MINNVGEATNGASIKSIEFGVNKENQVDRAHDSGIIIQVYGNPKQAEKELLGDDVIEIPAHDTRIEEIGEKE